MVEIALKIIGFSSNLCGNTNPLLRECAKVAVIAEPTLKQQLEMPMKESMSLPESITDAASRVSASKQLTNSIKVELAVFASSGVVWNRYMDTC